MHTLGGPSVRAVLGAVVRFAPDGDVVTRASALSTVSSAARHATAEARATCRSK